MESTKLRILTGDTPTGKLHLGHYVGSIENRLALQDQYDCYFIIANKHAFTTRADKPADIRQSVLEIATDYLAVGIDPNKSTMFVQSEVPAIDELTFFFSMLIPPRISTALLSSVATISASSLRLHQYTVHSCAEPSSTAFSARFSIVALRSAWISGMVRATWLNIEN